MIQEESLCHNKTFCILPWIHVHLLPNSLALPCSLWTYDEPLGNASVSSLNEIWNSPGYRELRMKMVAAETSKGCQHCYSVEDSNGISLRQWSNEKFKHHIKSKIAETGSDGNLPKMEMAYFDIRFSNICNFKCRGCSPELSSSWYDDFNKLYDTNPDGPRLIKINHKNGIWNELLGLIETVEEVAFAGGEPLLMEEHYDILEELLRRKKNNVAISYNTNFSTTQFKDKNICDYWNQFSNVSVGISIDDIGSRGEYFRHGMNWKNTLSNIRFVKSQCPHIKIYVNCTINIMNILYLPEIHRELIREGIIGPQDFYASLLTVPEELSIKIMPTNLKEDSSLKISNYIHEYSSSDWDPEVITYLDSMFHSIVQYMNQEDKSHLLLRFLDRTKKLDKIRGESFEKTFPDLAAYFSLT